MNRIYVFSATGTGLGIAQKIAKEMAPCEIVSIPKLMKENNWSIEGGRVGIIFPCYYGSMPQLIRKFIENAKSISANYMFAVASAGGDSGYSMKHLKESLEMRGVKLNLGQQLIIASNYMYGWYYNMLMPNIETLNNRLNEMDKVLGRMIEQIHLEETSICKQNRMGYLMPITISATRYVRDTRPWDSEFNVTDSCNQCGVCEKVCPVGNISFEGKTHVFRHNCQRCMACVQYCPKSAFVINNKPMNKSKYTFPEITLKEIITFNRG